MAAHCKDHCPNCGSHFSSVGAFDAHRAGDHQAGTRHCLDPYDADRLAAKDTMGVCDIYPDRVKRGVIVWTLAAAKYGSRDRLIELSSRVSS
jgi:hypothetical protein